MNTPAHTLPESEWIRPQAAQKQFSVSRATLYNWMQAGYIKHASIRPRGSIRGVRLINVDSLRSFIESHASATPAAQA